MVGATPVDANARRRVLLVDDEQRLRGILARYLRVRGHEVLEAATGCDARRCLSAGDIDVLLLDVNLPDETGWDVLRWLRARQDGGSRQSRVVILSAAPPSAKRIEQLGPDAVLTKPFPIDALSRLVETDCRPTAGTGFE